MTLDGVFELVEGNLSSERQKDISDIGRRFEGDISDGGWSSRTAKAICLLEFVRDLPRTPANIAAMLRAPPASTPKEKPKKETATTRRSGAAQQIAMPRVPLIHPLPCIEHVAEPLSDFPTTVVEFSARIFCSS